MQDLYSTDPTQETNPRSGRFYGPHQATLIGHTDHESTVPALKDHSATCIENAIASGDTAEQRKKFGELVDLISKVKS